MTTAPPQHTLKEICDILEVSAEELAKMTNLHPDTIADAISGGRFNKNVISALLIAEALGMEVHEIKWLKGISGTGRPPLTGSVFVERTVSFTMTEQVVVQLDMCPVHHLVLPATKVCDYCL